MRAADKRERRARARGSRRGRAAPTPGRSRSRGVDASGSAAPVRAPDSPPFTRRVRPRATASRHVREPALGLRPPRAALAPGPWRATRVPPCGASRRGTGAPGTPRRRTGRADRNLPPSEEPRRPAPPGTRREQRGRGRGAKSVITGPRHGMGGGGGGRTGRARGCPPPRPEVVARTTLHRLRGRPHPTTPPPGNGRHTRTSPCRRPLDHPPATRGHKPPRERARCAPSEPVDQTAASGEPGAASPGVREGIQASPVPAPAAAAHPIRRRTD